MLFERCYEENTKEREKARLEIYCTGEVKRLEYDKHVWRVERNVLRNVFIRNLPSGPRQRWQQHRMKKDLKSVDRTKQNSKL